MERSSRKVEIGEHIRAAAIREVMEETGTSAVQDYKPCGFVSERLVNSAGELESHFHIFLGNAAITDYSSEHREGELGLFSEQNVIQNKEQFLPSDWQMFTSFISNPLNIRMFEVELVGRLLLSFYCIG